VTLTGYDAAYPVANAPKDDVVFGYLGGDTPHAWSLADWNSQPARYRIPIWTRDNPGGYNGASEARAALAKLDSLGAPRGILVALDYELAQDATYLEQFDGFMVSVGNKVAVYGSKSTLFNNPKPSGGYWPADITDHPHLYPGSLLTQYEFAGDWDDDTVSSALLPILWDSRPTAPTTTTSQEDTMLILRVQGSDSVYGLDGGTLWGVSDPTSLQAYINAGVQQATVTPEEIARIQAAQPVAATVTVDSSQLTSALVAALSDAGLLAKEGAALAHAEAVQEHNDTPPN
jgi:hypothetical protein